jgi:NhaP-type Na+/H+ or K+/H+ antiporter
MNVVFLVFCIGIIMFISGRYFQDYVTGILGGFALFLLGVQLYMNPITNVDGFLSTVIASICFAFGGYVWIMGSIELIRDQD